ncbi:unnamed protein product [Phyllotreta striolata]|uniref:Uncharacterized protein n=1 Tax=Phyllotreta striolata TaxID=444603 RepID=A0A9N9XL06_PHYSR|nr:unnamed protein product [Phyllotreta striolata]
MLLFIILNALVLQVLSSDPIISLPNGKIRGEYVRSSLNKNFNFYAYQGIPFGEPPVGKLRFQAPQPVKNWEGIKDVKDGRISCYETDRASPFAREDCLYLNVFTPAAPSNRTKLEVLVYIYGGIFIHGNMGYGHLRPSFLMEDDVVVVNFNYRVGPFGFLSTLDTVMPGNMGLKDQQLALKWVQKNIHLFGGDPKKVTIMGQSAGSASVTFQLLSPGSAGLFRGAIGCSGSALNDWAIQPNPLNTAYGIAAEIDPNFTRNKSTQELLHLLQTADVTDITKTSNRYRTFSPVVEVEHEGAFLTELMYGLAESGKFNKVPVLMGFNSEESLISVKDADTWIAYVKKYYDKDLRTLVDNDLISVNDTLKRQVGQVIKRIYVGNGTFEEDPGRGLQLKSDNRFIRGIIKFAELIAKHVKVYFYEFSYHGDIGGTKFFFNDTGKVAHAEDQRYFWTYFTSYDKFPKNDVTTVKRYNKLLVNFIKHLNPTPGKDELLENITWPTVTNQHYYYLDLDTNLAIKENPRSFSYRKWVAIYEKYAKKPFVYGRDFARQLLLGNSNYKRNTTEMKNGRVSPSNEEESSHGCSKQKQKRLVIIALVTGTVLLVIGLFYLGFSAKVETCDTTQCIRTASDIKRHIDNDADPCDDFYRYSCGSYRRRDDLDDPRKSDWSQEDARNEEVLLQIRYERIMNKTIRDMLQGPEDLGDPRSWNAAKRFYRACMDESAIAREGLGRMRDVLKSMGGWPTLAGDDWKEQKFDWMEMVHKLRELGLNFDVFFRVAVERDAERRSGYVLSIHEIPYDELEFSSEVSSMISEYMVELSQRFGAARSIAKRDAKEVLRIYQELAKDTREARSRSRLSDLDEKLTLSELQRKYPDINWHSYLNGLLKPSERISYEEEILVKRPEYLKNMVYFLGITSKRNLANIICWHALQQLTNYMPEEIARKAYELLDRINGEMINFRAPRWKTCVTETKARLSPVLSAAYIQKFFTEETRDKAMQMTRLIKKQFEENLRRIDWMDEETKELVIQKLHASGEQWASDYLYELLEETKVFGEVAFNETKFLDAVLRFNLVNLHLNQSKLRRAYTEDSYNDINFVSGLNVKYSPTDNLLTFPVGIFGGVYYQNDRPEYMNYGILGAVIAREVSHIFTRAQHGDSPSGELRSWWSTNSLANYAEKSRCIAEQYRQECHANIMCSSKMNEEHMADLTGIKVSYEAYNAWIREHGAQPVLPDLKRSSSQLFWIATAIRYCSRDQAGGRYSPAKSLVNVPMRNLGEFSYDFGCTRNTAMNPDVKCKIW